MKSPIGSSAFGVDSDFVDRLNYGWTGALLLVLTSLVSLRQGFGNTIHCWVPQEFTQGNEIYSNSKCWTSNKYQPYQDTPTSGVDGPPGRVTNYHQWVPIVLAAQALMFYLPCIVWRLLMAWSGFDVRGIMRMARDTSSLLPEALNRNARTIASHIDGCIQRQSISWSNFLVVLYLLIKLFYLANSIAQIVIVVIFTGTKYKMHGIRALYDILILGDLPESANLPRTVFCESYVKKVGRNHMYNFQCSLAMTSLLEKIFLLTWFWFLLVTLVNLVSLVFWVVRLVIPRLRMDFVHHYLKTRKSQQMSRVDQAIDAMFVEQYLRIDGVFVLRLIAANCGDLLTGEVVRELCNGYKQERLEEIKRPDLHDGSLELTQPSEPV